MNFYGDAGLKFHVSVRHSSVNFSIVILCHFRKVWNHRFCTKRAKLTAVLRYLLTLYQYKFLSKKPLFGI